MQNQPEKKDLYTLFNPKSIAVVGASNNPGKWGCNVTRNLLMGGFEGNIFPVNPKEKKILGLNCYPELMDLPETPELVVCAIPAKAVPGLMRTSAKIGTKNMLIISSNFSEVGPEGQKLEDEIIFIANQNNINFIGPNTMGIVSNPAKVYAAWALDLAPPGHLSVCSQSGNLGTQLVNWGFREGIGFARYVGSGNEAYLKTEDYLQYFGEDEETDVIALYIEGLDNGRRFLEIAKEIVPRKPIIVLKRGASPLGKAAARSHTGAVTGDYQVYEAAFKQAGITIANNTQDLLDYAKAFHNLPKTRGKRTAIVTLGGGWGVVAADASSVNNLELPEFSQECLDAIDKELPEFWSKQNPIDLVGSYNRSNHLSIVEAVLKEDNIDAVLTLGMVMGRSYNIKDIIGNVSYRLNILDKRTLQFPFYLWDSIRGYVENIGITRKKVLGALNLRKSHKTKVKKDDKKKNSAQFSVSEFRLLNDINFGRELMKLQKKYNKPIVTVTFYPDQIPNLNRKLDMVAYEVPEKGVKSLARVMEYSMFCANREPESTVEDEWKSMKIAFKQAEKIIKDKKGALSESESKKLLQCYGIPVTSEIMVQNLDEAVAQAEKMGYPVVMKIDSPDILHKTDAGAVAVNIRTENQLRRAWDRIMKNVNEKFPNADIKGMSLQEMIESKRELLVGMTHDHQFGPVLVFGMGGIFVEVFMDVVMRIIPISKRQANEMITEIKTYKILKGTRGMQPADIDAIADILWRLSKLAWDFKDRIVEMDINPVMALPKGSGAKAVDALVVLN